MLQLRDLYAYWVELKACGDSFLAKKQQKHRRLTVV